jgi:hypothetical protein
MAGPTKSKRPKLSLQTKPIHHGSGVRSRKLFVGADPKSPTAFNTLSNVYTTAIERSTPTHSTPLTAIKLHPPPLKLQTDLDTLGSSQPSIETSCTALPDTPLSAKPVSPTQKTSIVYPSTMTPTPPLSAGGVDSMYKTFSFSSMDTTCQTGLSPPTRRHVSFADPNTVTKAPYSHNRSLHSILRNSPLQSSGAKSPGSSRRQTVRIQERIIRRVGYESPLTRTITTEKYTRSHIELLAEDASPYTPSPVPEDPDIDLTMAYFGNEMKDGGQTPGPFEEMRRQMTGLATETPVRSSKPDGILRRKRKEKKRRWVWTIGKDDEESESGAMAAIRAAAGETLTPRTSEPLTAIELGLEMGASESDATTETDEDHMDVDMSETSSCHSSRATSPHNTDVDSKTLMTDYNVASRESSPSRRLRLSPVDLVTPEGSN